MAGTRAADVKDVLAIGFHHRLQTREDFIRRADKRIQPSRFRLCGRAAEWRIDKDQRHVPPSCAARRAVEGGSLVDRSMTISPS